MLAATWAVGYGLSLILQDRGIWASAVYDTARLVPGSPPSWGIILSVGGLMMFVGMHLGRRGLMRYGAWIGLLWHFFFVVSLSKEVIEGDMSMSPVVNYTVAFVAYAILIVTYRGKNAIRHASQESNQSARLDDRPRNAGLQHPSAHH